MNNPIAADPRKAATVFADNRRCFGRESKRQKMEIKNRRKRKDSEKQ
jgi:hypothetical protein